jgi:hypothetical protein
VSLLVTCVVLAFFAATATASAPPTCHFSLAKVDTLEQANFTKTQMVHNEPYPGCYVYLLNASEKP